MKIAAYIKDSRLETHPRWKALRDGLAAGGAQVYPLSVREDLQPGTGLLLSVGGDGTFLSASKRVGNSGVPVLGVNLGRLGFLSENRPEEVLEPVLQRKYTVEDRSLLAVDGLDEGMYPYALNEVAFLRSGAAILGIKVSVDGQPLPPYWADGLLVATSSGSTAYSLSVGGPICMPDAPVLIIAPIAPHNLNVRPLIVPESAQIEIEAISRDGGVRVSLDNRTLDAPSSVRLKVRVAQFSLKKVRLPGSGFVKALTSKLFWGEDIRSGNE